MNLPMFWNPAEPSDARILERGVRIETLGDDVTNEGGALLSEQFELSFLRGDQSINSCGLTVKECRDDTLGIEGRQEH